MKEIKKTVETVTGYEAFDGTQFTEKEQCEAYESTALNVVLARLKKLVIKELYENEIFENQGYGSEEYQYWVMDIKDKADVDLFNQFRYFTSGGTEMTDDYIGKRVLVGTGYCYDAFKYRSLYIKGTYDEMIEQYKKDLEKVFKEKEDETE